MNYFDENKGLLNELNAFKHDFADKMIEDHFFRRYLPLDMMKRTTYPGGFMHKYLIEERGLGTVFNTRYYSQTIVLHKDKVEEFKNDEHGLWMYITAHIQKHVKLFRTRFQRHLCESIPNKFSDLQVQPYSWFTDHPLSCQYHADEFTVDKWHEFCRELQKQSDTERFSRVYGIASTEMWNEIEDKTPKENRFADLALARDRGIESLVIYENDEAPDYGRVPIIYDKYLDPTKRCVHVLDFDVMELLAHEQFNFKWTDWTTTPPELDMSNVPELKDSDFAPHKEALEDCCYCLIIFFGAVICSEFRNLGVFAEE